MAPDIIQAPTQMRLPKLPIAEFSIRVSPASDQATITLANLLAEGLKGG